MNKTKKGNAKKENAKMNWGVLALLLVGLVAVAGSVAAVGGFFPGQSPGQADEVRAALEANDYSAWKSAIESQLSEDNFNQQRAMLVEMEQKDSYRQAMMQAEADGDYDAWKAAAESMGLNSTQIMSEEDFNLLVELHQARASGDATKASELMSELKADGVSEFGFGIGPRGRDGFGHDMHDEMHGFMQPAADAATPAEVAATE